MRNVSFSQIFFLIFLFFLFFGDLSKIKKYIMVSFNKYKTLNKKNKNRKKGI